MRTSRAVVSNKINGAVPARPNPVPGTGRKRLIHALILCTLTSAGIATPSYARAGNANEVSYKFDIVGQRLPEALRNYAQISGQEIIFTEDYFEGTKPVTLRGDYTAIDALDRLLQGTGLKYERSPSGAIMIRRAGEGNSSAKAVQDSSNTAEQNNSKDADKNDGSRFQELQEIVVMAQKRSTALQETPISVTALSGEELQRAQITALADIKSRVPNFQMGDSGGFTQITVRGIGISNFSALAEGAVAVNLNEVYVSRPIAQGTSLYDISAIEVLRGPQGTLYGRNATAGAVNITTTRPTDELAGFGRLTIGNYGQVRFEGAIGGPAVEDKLLVRLAGFREKRNGYGENIVTGTDIDDEDAYGIRGTLVFTPTDELKATLIGEYNDQDNHGGGFHYVGPLGLTGLPGALGIPPVFVLLGDLVPSDPRDLAHGIDPSHKVRTSSVTGMVEWGGDAFGLKSITGYRDQNVSNVGTIAGANLLGGVALTGEPAHQFSQEIQTHYDTERVNLTAGLFYFDEKADASPATVYVSNLYVNNARAQLGLPPLPITGFTHLAEIGGQLKTTAKAVFAEGTMHLTDKLSATAGIRYSTERKKLFQRNMISFDAPYIPGGENPVPAAVAIPSRKFDGWTPKFGIQYQVTPETLLYATYAKGFKAGGFDAGSPPSLVAEGFEPEKLTDYEGGLKTMLFDRRLRLNVSGFYYDYTDLQVQQTRGFNTIVTANAATARVYGAEVEISALVTDALTIDANASWLHARYKEYSGTDSALPLLPSIDFEGNRMNNAPDFRAFLAASYRWDFERGKIRLRAEGEYSSKFYFTPSNIPLAGQSAYSKANAFLTYASNAGWYSAAFVRNITDKTTLVAVTPVSELFGSPAVGTYAPPRTYGVEFGYTF